MELRNSLPKHTTKENIQAFKAFFESFYPSVCLFAKKYLKELEQAEDIAQEAFVEFWKLRDTIHEEKAAKGFIYTVTRNRCLNFIRNKTVHELILKEEVFRDDFFEEMVLEEETYQLVHKAINKLPPQSRNIVRLSLEGKKNLEIAGQLNISINTVKTLKKNAYKELRSLLKDRNFILCLLGYFLK